MWVEISSHKRSEVWAFSTKRSGAQVCRYALQDLCDKFRYTLLSLCKEQLIV
jgi:hypothetical protein